MVIKVPRIFLGEKWIENGVLEFQNSYLNFPVARGD